MNNLGLSRHFWVFGIECRTKSVFICKETKKETLFSPCRQCRGKSSLPGISFVERVCGLTELTTFSPYFAFVWLLIVCIYYWKDFGTKEPSGPTCAVVQPCPSSFGPRWGQQLLFGWWSWSIYLLILSTLWNDPDPGMKWFSCCAADSLKWRWSQLSLQMSRYHARKKLIWISSSSRANEKQCGGPGSHRLCRAFTWVSHAETRGGAGSETAPLGCWGDPSIVPLPTACDDSVFCWEQLKQLRI